MSSEWLDRVWTFQEVILASNPVIVRGDQAIPFAGLQMGLRVYLGTRTTKLWSPLEVTSSKVWAFPRLKNRDGARTPGDSPTIRAWIDIFHTWSSIQRPLRPPTKRETTALEKSTMSVYDLQTSLNSGWSLVEMSFAVMTVGVLGLPLGAGVGLNTLPGTPFWWLLFVLIIIVPSLALLPRALHALFIDVWYIFDTGSRYAAWELSTSSNTSSMALFSMLRTLRDRKCSEEKDRVYGTYGVLRSLGAELCSADYSHSLGRVYLDFLTDILKWKPSLICFLADAGGTPVPGAPSWVPDWRASGREEGFSARLYAAVTEKNSIPRIEIQGDELRIRGMCLGTVGDTTAPFMVCTCSDDSCYDDCGLRTAIGTLLYRLKVIGVDKIIRKANESMPKPNMGASNSSNSSLGDDADSWYHWLQRFIEKDDKPINEGTEHKSIMEVFDDELKRNSKLLDRLEHDLPELGRQKGFWFSRQGEILKVPRDTTVGDAMFFLEGMTTPVILRDSTLGRGKYTFVGPAFVWGVPKLKEMMPEEIGLQWEDVVLT